MSNVNNILLSKVKVYLDLLAKTKIELITLKKEENPLHRVMEGMSSLPELKERVLLCRKILKDLKDIQDVIND